MDEVPYKVLMMMNAVIPDYSRGENGTPTAPEVKKRMNLFELAEAVSRRERV